MNSAHPGLSGVRVVSLSICMMTASEVALLLLGELLAILAAE